MSLNQAKHLAHNLRVRATEQGNTEAADLAQVLYEIAQGLENDHRDITRTLNEIQDKVRNLR